MATCANLIERAMRLLGQVPTGGTPTTSEYAIGLIAVNGMLSSWCNEKLMCYAMREESLTFTAAVSRTIGPSGNLVTTRPVEISAAWVVDSGNTSQPVDIITDEEYAAIPDKTATSNYPSRANYKASMPDGTIYFYPVPTASGTMKLLTRTPLTAFSATSDSVSLPPGWEDAIAFNLAVVLGPEFETEAKGSTVEMARTTKAAIKRVNSAPIKAYTELAMLVGPRRRSNIETDSP